MANCRKFKFIPLNGKFQVRQFGGMGMWQPRGELHDTEELAQADIDKRLAEFGATRSMGRSWAT